FPSLVDTHTNVVFVFDSQILEYFTGKYGDSFQRCYFVLCTNRNPFTCVPLWIRLLLFDLSKSKHRQAEYDELDSNTLSHSEIDLKPHTSCNCNVCLHKVLSVPLWGSLIYDLARFDRCVGYFRCPHPSGCSKPIFSHS